MKFGFKRASSVPSGARFDELRARLELEVAWPAVIAVTSSLDEDGKDVAARGLAYSLASTGYSTILVDTSLGSRSLAKPVPGLVLEEIVRRQSIAGPEMGNLATLTVSDPMLQRTTNQRGLQLAFDILRARFNYVVINAEFGAATSFATSVVTAADAVLVTVKRGRRKEPDDVRLAAILERLGDRFFGVIALDKALIEATSSTLEPDAMLGERRGRNNAAHSERENQRREIVESST